MIPPAANSLKSQGMPRTRYRILFLDVDGVLNCLKQRTFPSNVDNNGAVDAAALARDALRLDPDLVGRLTKLVRDTDSHIVLSSAWRLHPAARRALASTLSNHGIGKSLLGVTSSSANPRFPPLPVLASEAAETRCYEIMHWLYEHNELVATWAAVDDLDLRDACARQRHADHSSDVAARMPLSQRWASAFDDVLTRFVRTDQALGLTKKDAAELSRVLTADVGRNDEEVGATAAAVATVFPYLAAPTHALTAVLPAPPSQLSLPLTRPCLPVPSLSVDLSSGSSKTGAQANAEDSSNIAVHENLLKRGTGAQANAEDSSSIVVHAKLLKRGIMPKSSSSALHGRSSSGSMATGVVVRALSNATSTSRAPGCSPESDEDPAAPAPTITSKCEPVTDASGDTVVIAPCSAGAAAPPSPQSAGAKESPPPSPNMASMLEVAAALTRLGGLIASSAPLQIVEASTRPPEQALGKRNLVQTLIATQGEGDASSEKKRCVVHESAVGSAGI